MSQEVIIYKADQRKILTHGYLQLCTFFDSTSGNGDSKSFLDLSVFNDIILHPGQKIPLCAYDNLQLLILPIIGGVDIHTGDARKKFIGAEQYFWKPAGQSIQVENPYSMNDMSCLIIGLRSRTTFGQQSQEGTINLRPENELHPFIDFGSLKISLGIFSGRGETVYNRKSIEHGLFCMPVRGVFEISGRLLHPRDGLSFTNHQQLDIESLSEKAILLVIETT